MTSDKLMTNAVWPVMLTPMNWDRTIDWDGVDRITDWYIDAGCEGLFTNSRSSEVEFLTPEERVELAARVVKRAAGRAAVVATGTFGETAEQEIESIKRIHDVGADAVIILTNHLGDQGTSEAQWTGQLERIVDGTGDIPLGFYECPTPWKRLVPANVYEWAAHTGRFVFHKDVSHSVPDMAAKLAVSEGTPMRLYNGQISSVIESMQLGGSGHSGYASSLYPELVVWLCANGTRDDEQTRLVQRLLTVAERMINVNYPSSAKQWLSHRGEVEITPISRMPLANALDDHGFAPLQNMTEIIESLDLQLA
ncbi:dihydrodipicolinate synthase family protein [Plantibacter sp. Mn2098]|uniref:dihydrodipicolinate synthase family protein n=1 Tax=Plantibacter sp. Mn2098 TaxID=3395266 RepID=UPI003BCA3A80